MNPECSELTKYEKELLRYFRKLPEFKKGMSIGYLSEMAYQHTKMQAAGQDLNGYSSSRHGKFIEFTYCGQ